MSDHDRQHISKECLSGPLPLPALTHLSRCGFCQEKLADYVEEHELLKAPRDLSASILDRADKLDIKLIAGANHASKRLQLFCFGLKVGAAVLCSLTLLAFTPDFSRQPGGTDRTVFNTRQGPRHMWIYEKVEDFTELLHQFSFEQREVINHDKKEK